MFGRIQKLNGLHLFRAYLQGIETENETINADPKSKVSSLPTRNWNNINQAKKLSPLASGFEPTYKELKLFINIHVKYLNFRFEPTYKELKPKFLPIPTVASAGFRAYLQGIETLASSLKIIWKHSVSSLPTRNWNNPFWCLAYIYPKAFRAYLQGIETIKG